MELSLQLTALCFVVQGICIPIALFGDSAAELSLQPAALVLLSRALTSRLLVEAAAELSLQPAALVLLSRAFASQCMAPSGGCSGNVFPAAHALLLSD
jgi:hypothetical protein